MHRSLRSMLAWMDLEMTGLDVTRHVILEMATIITDDELNIVAEGPNLVIHEPPEALARMEKVVRDMHERSGLLAAVTDSDITLEAAGQTTLDFLRQHVPEPGTVPLCGNSIGTDRRFIAVYLPAIDSHLHYRTIDVSTIKELARRWYPPVFEQRPTKASSHRALDDARESIDELRFYRDKLFV